jgi:hypothetical protein
MKRFASNPIPYSLRIGHGHERPNSTSSAPFETTSPLNCIVTARLLYGTIFALLNRDRKLLSRLTENPSRGRGAARLRKVPCSFNADGTHR